MTTTRKTMITQVETAISMQGSDPHKLAKLAVDALLNILEVHPNHNEIMSILDGSYDSLVDSVECQLHFPKR